MEVGPDPYSQEVDPQPDLLEAFADQEVTIFGITGTFKDLSKMCPVDLNDASITLEAKNEFVIKVANEAGLEIKTEYKSIFTQVTEKLGLERKFTVAEEATAPKEVELPKMQKPVIAENKFKNEQVLVKPIVVEVEDTRAQLSANIEAIEHLRQVVDEQVESERREEAITAATVEQVDAPNVAKVVVKRLAEVTPVSSTKVARKEADPIKPKIAKPVLKVQPKLTAKRQTIFTKSPKPKRKEPQLQEEVIQNSEPEPPVLTIKPAEQTVEVTSYEESGDPLITFKMPELSIEPETFDHFDTPEDLLLATALDQSWAEYLISDNSTDETTSSELVAEPALAVTELPAPVEQIEKALTALVEAIESEEMEEEGRVHQILAEIINLPESIGGLASGAEKDALIETRLEELFIELFEETGIEYTPEMLESFIKLTRTHYLNELFSDVKQMEKDPNFLQETGTKEFLQKLNRNLTSMKKVAFNLYELGKSVLRLYFVGPAPYYAI